MEGSVKDLGDDSDFLVVTVTDHTPDYDEDGDGIEEPPSPVYARIFLRNKLLHTAVTRLPQSRAWTVAKVDLTDGSVVPIDKVFRPKRIDCVSGAGTP